MLDLSNVTLVSIDSVADHYSKSNIRLAAISRIVPEILKKIKFGDVLMINPFGKNANLLDMEFQPHWKDFKVEENPKNIAWLNNYLIKVLPELIKTDWYLIIQWDGFPINANKWSNDFFEYPFLGGGHTMLNGGFSLRNTDTMRKMSKVDDLFEVGAEDAFYSCFLDNDWTKNKNTPFKIKFPTENLVNKFCFWDSSIGNKMDESFGWHRHSTLSKINIQKAFREINIFSNYEIRNLVSYCLYKEIDIPLPQDYSVIEKFDIEFNELFFNSY